jgi:hypothetical protein
MTPPLRPPRNIRACRSSELSFLLAEFLRTLSPLGAFAVVFIDEAQNLSPQLLEEIRILSDSDGRERQLQVILEPIPPPQAPSVDAEAWDEDESSELPPVVLRPSFTPNRGHS